MSVSLSTGEAVELTKVSSFHSEKEAPLNQSITDTDLNEGQIPSEDFVSEGTKNELNCDNSSRPRQAKLSRKLKDLFIGKEDAPDTKVTLKKELTVLSGVAFVTGNIIGSGIFITPNKILSNTGSFGVTLVTWVIGAVIALAGALCYVELGVVVRQSGGEYSIILMAYSFKKKNKWVELFGRVMAFQFTWTSVFVIRSIGPSIILLTCARYLSRPFYIDCEIPREVVTILALFLLILVSLVVSVSIKFTAHVITVLSGLKILALVFITLVGIVHVVVNGGFPSDLQYPFRPIAGHEPSVSSIAIALYGVTFAYDGWNVLNYAIEETKNFEKTLPRSLFIGIPIVAVCYLLVNVAYFGVLSYDQLLSTEAVGLPFGNVTLGKAGLVIIPLLVALSTCGAALSSVYSASRLIFAAARDGMLPEVLSGLHKTSKTPIPAIILQTLMCSIVIVIGDISSLLNSVSSVVFLFYGLVFVSLLIMRVTHKEQRRPFKAWCIIPVTVFSILVSIFLITLPLVREPVPSVIAFLVTLLGLPVYIFFVMETPWQLRPKYLGRISQHITQFTNALLNTESSSSNSLKHWSVHCIMYAKLCLRVFHIIL